MTEITDCTSDIDQSSLPADEVLKRIYTSMTVITGYETLPLRLALDRILAIDLIAPINIPPGDNSAMDGYAIHHQAIPEQGETTLEIIGTAYAGTPYVGEFTKEQCIRIMTGALLPAGTDTVIMQEQVKHEHNAIKISANQRAGQNVRKAGEDIQKNNKVLSKGGKITPADLGLMASIGVAEIEVYRRVRVAFFATGNELTAPGRPRSSSQIYDSNRYTLHGMLTKLGVEAIDMGIIPDNKAMLRHTFIEAAHLADVIVTTGGVSVGEADYVREIVADIGHVDFWKIASKPGRPLAYGSVNNALFFGLPGNPVSTMVTFSQYLTPALCRLMGQTENFTHPIVKMRCISPLHKRPGRVEYQRGIMFINGRGEQVVKTTGDQGSHMLSSMSKANCFIILSTETHDIPANTFVDIQPFNGMI